MSDEKAMLIIAGTVAISAFTVYVFARLGEPRSLWLMQMMGVL